MPRLRQRIPTETDSPASRLRKIINPGKRQRIPGSGRRRGQSNHIPKYSQAVILEALHTFGEDGRGRNGIVGLIHRAIREDVKHAITLLTAITPKLLEANIVRTDITYRTLAELDADLASHGLPTSKEVFRLDFSSDADDTEVTEAEIIAPERLASK